MDYLDKLNKEQREAATTIYGNLLILACAGSGKTHTLISRIAYMIDSGINPESILLLTFTNKAAEEMKRRIVRDVGDVGEGITASTFHSFCANLLRKYSGSVKIDNNFTVLDSPDSQDAISIAKEEYFEENKIKKAPEDFPGKKDIAAIYSYAINSCSPISDVIDLFNFTIFKSEIIDILNKYKNYKQKHNLMDYDDLLFNTYQVLNNNEDIREHLDRKYEFISCDEYQDTNILQDKILELLSRNCQNLAVVGDDNQSIYKFRCAEIKNILNFHKRYRGCKVVVLNQNYRSSQEILDFANSIMTHATEGINKNLQGQFNGEKPEWVIPYDSREEDAFIVKKILEYKRTGIPLNEMSVLIRNARQSFHLEVLLNNYGIPFKKFGGIKFLEKEVIKDILAFLRLSVNPKDELALYRLLQKYPGIGKGYAKKICEKISKEDISYLKELYKKTKFYVYLVELSDTLAKISSMDINEQLKYIISDYYPRMIKNSIDLSTMKNKEDYRATIKEQLEESKALLEMAKKYKSTKKFLEDLTLDATNPEAEGEFLNISTIHSAKGLEYEVVFIMDAIDGTFPRCKQYSDEDPEELRCLYVAVTRAKKHLFIISPQFIINHAGEFGMPISHFINYDNVINTMRTKADRHLIRKMRNRTSFY